MSRSNSGRTDLPVLVLSVLAVLVAGAISMTTISTSSDKNYVTGTSSPSEIADEAARAGLEVAQWHIECHGRTTAGSIGPHFCINGALYTAEWDDMNPLDSTVVVRSTGDYEISKSQIFRAHLESKIKVGFLPPHKNMILDSYYSVKREIPADFSPQ